MLQVHIIPALSDNYIYLLEYGGRASVVDPAAAKPVLARLQERKLKLDHILTTHHHYDHVAGNPELKKATGCTVIGPKDARIPELDTAVREGDTVSIGGFELKVMETPGHGRHDISFFLDASSKNPNPRLWCGDTLFVGGCGRLLEADARTMWKSLCRIADLPDETAIYCGHEYTDENLRFALSIEPKQSTVKTRLKDVRATLAKGGYTVPTTLQREKETNIFLRARDPSVHRALGMASASDADVFAELRRRKDQFG